MKEGYHEEVDHLKKAKTEGKTWLAELEEREREKTGIKNLRVRYKQGIWILHRGYQFL